MFILGCGKSSRVPEMILRDCESRNEVSFIQEIYNFHLNLYFRNVK